MRIKTLLMTGAVAGIAFVGSAYAKDTPSSKTPAQTATAQAQTQIDAMQTQISAMQAQVAYMKRQLEIMTEKNPPSAKTPKIVQSSSNKFSIESYDGQYSIGLTGRIHADAGFYPGFSPKTRLGTQNLNAGFNLRRARIGVTGKAAGDFTYQLVYDFGGSSDQLAAGNGNLQAAQVGYTGIKNTVIEFGYSDTFFTLDEATSSNDIMFMERATPDVVATNVNTGDFRSNFGARYFTDRLWLGAYVTGPTSGNAHGVGESFGAYERVAYQVLSADNYSLHVGAAIDEIIKAPNAGPGTANTFTLSDRPELRVDPTSLLSTGALGSVSGTGVSRAVDGGYITDLEVAGGYGAIYAQGEWQHFNINRLGGLSSLKFDSGYGEVGYTLTGETRKYKKGDGSYGGIVPAHAFSPKDGYWGAWEIGARFSYIDLTDQFTPGIALSAQPNAVNGGKEKLFTVGLNWYPNTYMRFMLNYIHNDFDKANPATSGSVLIGRNIGATMDAIALRTQVAW